MPLPLVFLAATAVLAFAMHPGIYLNDEIPQAAGLNGLAHGHIWISGDLPGYAHYVQPMQLSGKETIYGHPSIPAPGERGPPVGSTMLNVLALPLLGILTFLSLFLGTRGAILLPVAAVCAAAVWAVLRHRGVAAHKRGIAAAAAALAFLPFTDTGGPPDPTLEFSAILFVSIMAAAVAVAYLFDLLCGWLPERGALLAAGTLLATPAFFWAQSAKYTSMALMLVTLAAWCYKEGGRTGPLRTGLAFALAGLAVWNDAPWGMFLIAALGLVALGALRLGVRPALARAGAGAAGLLVGLLPDVLTRLLVSEISTYAHFGPASADGLLVVSNNVAQERIDSVHSLPGVLDFLHAAAYAAYRGFVWTNWLENKATLALLSIAPLAAAALVALASRRWRSRTPRPLVVLGVTYILVVLLVSGKRFINIGAGPDMRYGLTFWPFLAILWAPLVSDLVERRGLRWSLQAAGLSALATILLTVALNLGAHAAHQNLTLHGFLYDQTAVLRYGGLAVAGCLAVALLWRKAGQPLVDTLLMAALGMGAAAQVLVLCLLSGGGAFVAWPVGLAFRGLYWILVGGWPPYE